MPGWIEFSHLELPPNETIEDVGGTDHLTFTFPVRRGASFTGATASIDGLAYTIEGSGDLVSYQ